MTMGGIVGGAQRPVNAESWVLHAVSYPWSPQPDIVPFVSKRVNDKSLHVVCNEDEPTAVPPLSEVMNAVAEATGIASAR
jgi:hypothetical protein